MVYAYTTFSEGDLNHFFILFIIVDIEINKKLFIVSINMVYKKIRKKVNDGPLQMKIKKIFFSSCYVKKLFVIGV